MTVAENPSWCSHAFWQPIINLSFNSPKHGCWFFQAFAEILFLTGMFWISWYKDIWKQNELISPSFFAFFMEVTSPLSVEEKKLSQHLLVVLFFSYKQQNIMTYSVNISKHVLSKSQIKTPTEWQRKLPPIPMQHSMSSLSYWSNRERSEVGLHRQAQRMCRHCRRLLKSW